MLLQTPAGELWFAGWWGRVCVLNLDESIAPAFRQRCGCQIDPIDAESMSFLEEREFPGCTSEQIGHLIDFGIVV